MNHMLNFKLYTSELLMCQKKIHTKLDSILNINESNVSKLLGFS